MVTQTRSGRISCPPSRCGMQLQPPSRETITALYVGDNGMAQTQLQLRAAESKSPAAAADMGSSVLMCQRTPLRDPRAKEVDCHPGTRSEMTSVSC